MHGADRDIIWLQRDFGIYICNMFDTGQVCFETVVYLDSGILYEPYFLLHGILDKNYLE